MEEEIFSHSKLSLFENCPEAYKVKYIDKAFPDIPQSIHLFLGGVVHESLEWLHLEVQEGRSPGLDDLVEKFIGLWNEQITEDVRVTNGDIEQYFNKGVKFLVDYYQKNKPFSDNTIDIEKHIVFPLGNTSYKIQGYIDRIVKNEEGYEVHDYKTNEYMKTQDQVDADRQLAFYHIGLNNLFGPETKVKLIWHFLAHNKTIESSRTQEQLERLEKETIELIERIKSNSDWPSCGKHWCDWCAYKKSNGISEYKSPKKTINNELLKYIDK